MENIQEEVRERVKKHFGENVEINFHDERGDGRHFLIYIVSERFENKDRVERSQLVYEILGDLLKRDAIHALRMKLKTPQEIL